MKRLPLILATTLFLASANANDQVRDVQASLKARGFYYGEVTGEESTETGAAIRRFQIRNGITVTGKLNAGTLSALGLWEKKTAEIAPQPAPATQPAPAPVAPVQKQLNPPAPAHKAVPMPGEPMLPPKGNLDPVPEIAPDDAVQKPARHVKPLDPSAVEPPTPVPAPVSTPSVAMFRGTPYANAPIEVQMDVIRRAQAVMAARRFYRGPLDGVAGPATSEGIFLFQAEVDLRRTGRLDLDTLAEMNLLPRAAHGNPLLKPFYNPNRRRDRSVTWDYWER
jgi:peptidoglycan hydrolase-like protein with peptidoglycan-binding domain